MVYLMLLSPAQSCFTVPFPGLPYHLSRHVLRPIKKMSTIRDRPGGVPNAIKFGDIVKIAGSKFVQIILCKNNGPLLLVTKPSKATTRNMIARQASSHTD